MSNVPLLTQNDGTKIPAFGLGTYTSLGGDCERSVKDAIDAGYRHIDTAYFYENEEEVGRAVRDKIAEGVIKREDIYIVSKLWCHFHEPEKVEYACRKSLKNFGLDYVDAYLMHWPYAYVHRGDNEMLPTKANGEVELRKRRLSLVELNKQQDFRSDTNASTSNANQTVEAVSQTWDSMGVPPTHLDQTTALADEGGIVSLLAHQRSTSMSQELNAMEAATRAGTIQPGSENEENEEDTLLSGYIEEVVTAAIGPNQPNDIEFLAAEADRRRMYLHNEVSNIVACIHRGDDEMLPTKATYVEVELSDVDYLDTWKAMEKLVELGLAKSIGVSNFNSEQLKRLLSNCTIKPIHNQIECNPGLNQKKLIALCKELDIIVTAYCPLGRPDPAKKSPPYLFDPKVKEIGQKYNKTPAQVVLRYLIENGVVPIPKTVTKSRLTENIDVFDFKLSADDHKVMDTFNTGERLIPMDHAQKSIHYPFNIEF